MNIKIYILKVPDVMNIMYRLVNILQFSFRIFVLKDIVLFLKTNPAVMDLVELLIADVAYFPNVKF